MLTALVSLNCGAATPVQVVQDHTEEFLEKMNSKVLAPQLKALELIPESVECDILQSKSREEANSHLLNHLKEDADEESVREVFRIASEKTNYGKMKAFAASVLRELSPCPVQTLEEGRALSEHPLVKGECHKSCSCDSCC